MARTVVFDFDGVIHSYTSGWQGEDTIPDPPVPGIREALKEIHDAGYEVVVVSTRCATIKGHGAIEAWLYDNGLREYIDKVCKEKPPAVAYIDDRAICFDGHPETLLKKIQNFQPWYKMPTLTQPNEPLMLDSRLTPKMVTCPKGWKGVRYTRFHCPGCKKVLKKGEAYCHKCGQALIFPAARYDKENNRIWLDFSDRRLPEGEAK